MNKQDVQIAQRMVNRMLGPAFTVAGHKEPVRTAQKFKIIVGFLDERAMVAKRRKIWEEPYTEVVTSPEQWAKETIERFNDTLKPGERARELLGVEIITAEARPIRHNWAKQNLITQHTARHGIHDVMKCETCGITGKRFRLGADTTRDPKYRASVYAKCDTARDQLAKLELRRNK